MKDGRTGDVEIALTKFAPCSKKRVVIAAGAGMYWGTTAFRMSADQFFVHALDATALSVPKLAVLIVSVVLCATCFAARGVFIRTSFRRILLKSAFVFSIASFVMSVFFGVVGTGTLPSGVVMTFLRVAVTGVLSVLLMLAWGFVFVSMSKREASGYVIASSLVAAIAYLLECVVSEVVPGVPVVDAALAISSAFLLATPLDPLKRRGGALRFTNATVAFYFSRLLYGLAIGIATSMALTAGQQSTVSWVPSFAGAVALGCFGVLASRHSARFEIAFLPMVPLLAGGILFVPHFGVPDYVGVSLCASTIWLSWVILSSVQLSDLKRSFGMSDAGLVVSEKLVVIASWLVGEGLWSAIGKDSGLLADPLLTQGTNALSYLAILFSTGMLLFLANTRERQTVIQQVSERVDEEFRHIYKTIAHDYHLTDRECEVFSLVAQGHTRAYISKNLFISDGTVRSHIRSVYKKLDCHKKEELYALVDRYKRPIDDVE